MNVIELKGLTYKYSVGTPFESTAVDNVDLTIEKGEFCGIIGHTGSGKSTLLNILGLLDKQTDGDYYIDGKKVSSIPEREKAKLRNSHIGFVMQDFALVESTL